MRKNLKITLVVVYALASVILWLSFADDPTNISFTWDTWPGWVYALGGLVGLFLAWQEWKNINGNNN